MPCMPRLYASVALSLNSAAQLQSLNFSAKRVAYFSKYSKLLPLTLYLTVKNSLIFLMSLN